MNRSQEIIKAASELNIVDGRADFYAGANFADNHPVSPWHSIKDGELPQEAQDCIFSYQGELYKGFMLSDKSLHFDEVFAPYLDIYDVDYWMEIPELLTE